MFEVYSLFPQPIVRKKYSGHNRLKKKVLEFIEKNKDSEVDGIYSQPLKHFFNTSNESESKFFDCIDDEEFREFILESSSIFVNSILGLELIDEMILTDCWINICYENGEQRLHSHGNSFVSGTYYLNYDPENHSALKFENPMSHKTVPYMTLDTETMTEFNHVESYCHFIEEGDLILWSSHLSHGYDLNKKDGRVTISMNFVPSVLKNGPYIFKIQK